MIDNAELFIALTASTCWESVGRLQSKDARTPDIRNVFDII